MAEYSATHNAYLHRRRQSTTLTDSAPTPGVHFEVESRSEKSLTDKAQEYDRALLQSQIAASRRKAGSTLAASTSSIFGGPNLARTTILGDSQGSITLEGPATIQVPKAGAEIESIIPMDDLAPDGGVGSGLGESYVDGAKRLRDLEDIQTNEEPIEDVGILGLLAQIYGRRDPGPTRVIG